MGFALGTCDEKLVMTAVDVCCMEDEDLPVKSGYIRESDFEDDGFAYLYAPRAKYIKDSCPVCGSKKIDRIEGSDDWDDPTHYYYTVGCPDCGINITETWEVAVPWGGTR